MAYYYWTMAGLAFAFWGFTIFWYLQRDIRKAWDNYRRRWTRDGM
jgi:hypothetical protein